MNPLPNLRHYPALADFDAAQGRHGGGNRLARLLILLCQLVRRIDSDVRLAHGVGFGLRGLGEPRHVLLGLLGVVGHFVERGGDLPADLQALRRALSGALDLQASVPRGGCAAGGKSPHLLRNNCETRSRLPCPGGLDGRIERE